MTRTTATLLFTASALALSANSAHASEIIFSSSGQTGIKTGERVTQLSGVTQIKLDDGAMLSIVDGAEYQINADGTVELFSGSVTVAGADNGAALIRMPDGAQGSVAGAGSAASFSVNDKGDSFGHTLSGGATVTRGRNIRDFRAGEFWQSAGRQGLRQMASRNEAAPAPQGTGAGEELLLVADMEQGGPLAAAQNGLPVSLGDALAAAGASSDILSAARNVELATGNPSLDSFPTGDLAALVAAAADLEGLNGGTPFPAAQADIIRTYLGFLADGGSGANFLTAYAGFLNQYLGLIRSGALPSSFDAVAVSDINAYLGYAGRISGIAGLPSADQILVERYLAFLGNGGNADNFAPSFTGLVNAYFQFVRAGGNPDSFAGASQAVLNDYIAFVAASGLSGQLNAADRTLLAAYNANGGLGFAREFQTALDAYFAFLESGNLPSDFAATDLAVLQSYLEQLQGAGLLGQFLGDQAGFYTNYLTFVQGGGNADDFAELNANVFAGFTADLNAYYAYLLNGGQPSAYAPLTRAQIAQYVAALQAQGAAGRFLDDLAGFYTDYAAFLASGGNPDVFTGLPVLNLPAFADALNAYAAFLGNGGLPADFTATQLVTLANYLAALQSSGELNALLGANAGLLTAYFAFLEDGGTANAFPGLPLYATYVDGLEAYFTFLDNGGLPADFTALTPQQIQSFLAALAQAGGLTDQLGGLASFYTSYFAFISAGGNPAQFAGLPVYATYATDLQAYFAFLGDGGLPADFTALTQAQITSYLAALNAAGGFQQQIGGDAAAFFTNYFAFVDAGNDPASFAGLPIYASYVTQLNAYFAFLANGGLPADYAALDQVTIAAYLAALTNVTGGLDSFAGLNSFFAAYATFVLGGGDPGDFTGLPIYAEYLSGLSEFYAFLLGGGVPSAFTGLTAQEIEDYLAALADVGLLGGTFDGEVLSFFNTYLAFLAGGGLPDDFDDLPGALDNTLDSLYQVALRSTGASFGPVMAATIETDGQITTTTTANGVITDWVATGDTARERGRLGNDVAWTRYERAGASGAFTNQNTHLLIGDPATNLPASGTVEFKLVGGTQPTDVFGEQGAAGSFSGSLAVAFKAFPEVGLDFNVYVGDRGWNARTTGGADDPDNRGLVIGADGRFNSNPGTPVVTTSLLGGSCAVQCSTSVFGSLFGNGAPFAGFGYVISDQSSAATNAFANVNGVAVFGQTGTEIAQIGMRPVITAPVPTGTPLIIANPASFTATTGIKYNLRGPFVGLSGFSADSVVSNANGGVTAILEGFRPRSIGTASAVDVSTNARFAIGRWTNGIYVSAEPSENTTLSATQGVHYLFAGPTTTGYAIPTVGRIDYDLIAATAPTIADGSLAPGRFQADMAVLFGSTNRVAIEGNIIMPTATGDYVYGFSTTGGIANASQSTSEFRVTQGRNVNFEVLGSGITTSDNACDINCTIAFAGYFAGGDVNQIGLTYSAPTTVDATINTKRIDGAAIFGNGVYDSGISTVPFGPGGPTLAYTGGFVTAGTGLFARSASFNPFSSPGTPPNIVTVTTQGTALEAVLDSNGGLERYRTRFGTSYNAYDRGTAQQFDVSGNADVLIGRWSNGTFNTRFSAGAQPIASALTANQGFHYFLSDGFTGASAFPAGRVEYDLLAATRPTIIDGSLAPGTFTANAAITYGASNTLAIAGRLAFEGLTYDFATSGGVAGAGGPITISAQNGSTPGGFFGFSAPGQTNDGRSGTINFEARMSDAQGSSFGTAYTASFFNPSSGLNSNGIIGAAIFGARAPAGGGGTGGGTGGGFTGTRNNIVFYTYVNGSLSSAFGGSATLANGQLTTLTSALGTLSNGPTTIVEARDFGEIAFARWTNGTVQVPLFGPAVVGPNGGYHVMAGSTPTSLPGSGTVTYSLAGTTSATNNIGSAPGTMTGNLAIAFGSTSRVGFNLGLNVGGKGYNVATNGGAANPGASGINLVLGTAGPTFSAIFNSNTAGSVTGSGGACVSGCNVSVAGALYGANGRYAGVAVNVLDTTTGAAVLSSGLAIFAAPGAPTSGTGGSGVTTAGALAPTAVRADWDRWDVAADTAITARTDADMAPGIDALLSSGIQFSAEQMQRLEAHLATQAQ